MEKFEIKKYIRGIDLIELQIIFDKYNSLYENFLTSCNSLMSKFDVNSDETSDDNSLFEALNLSNYDKFKSCENRLKNNIFLLKNNINDIIYSYINDIEEYLINKYSINIKPSYKVAPRTIKLLRTGLIPLIPYDNIIEHFINKIYLNVDNKDKTLESIGVDSTIKLIKSHMLLFSNITFLEDNHVSELEDVFRYRLIINFQQILINKYNLFTNSLKILEGKSILDDYNNLIYIDYNNYLANNYYCKDIDYAFVIIATFSKYSDNIVISFKKLDKAIIYMNMLGYKYDDINKKMYIPNKDYKNYIDEDDIKNII